MRPQLRAVLFDMDGLLVDSEPLWFEVERDVVASLGGLQPWTRIQADGLVGRPLRETARALLEAAEPVAAPAPPMSAAAVERVAGSLVDGMVARLADDPPWRPGARDLLESVAEAGVARALVSSSPRVMVDAVLRALPLGSFDATVAGDEVSALKPDPEPYRRAAAMLGCPPSGCVVLEDSASGAASGSAAGCAVLVVPDRAPLPVPCPWPTTPSLMGVSPDALVQLLGGDGVQDVHAGGATRGEQRRQHADDGRQDEDHDDEGDR